MSLDNPLFFALLLLFIGIVAIGAAWVASVMTSRRGGTNATPEVVPAVPVHRSSPPERVLIQDHLGNNLFADGIPGEPQTAETVNQLDKELQSILLDKDLDELASGFEWEFREHTYWIQGQTIDISNQTYRLIRISDTSEQRFPVPDYAPPPEVISLLTSLSSARDEAAIARSTIAWLQERLPADVIEFNRLDPISSNLLPHRSFSKRGAPYRGKVSGEAYHLGEGYTGWLIEHRTPLLIPNTRLRRDIQPKTPWETFPISSYLGFPMLHSGELFGTLEVAALDEGAFGPEDEWFCSLAANQSAISLKLMGLTLQSDFADLTSTATARMMEGVPLLPHRHLLVQHLSQTIAEILHVRLVGFYYARANDQSLQPIEPFFDTRGELDNNALARDAVPGADFLPIWTTQDYWISNHATTDPAIESLQLGRMVERLSVQQILIAPLRLEDDRIGILLVADKLDGAGFNTHDAQITAQLARQCAPMIQLSNQLSDRSSPQPDWIATEQFSNAREAEDRIQELRIEQERSTTLLQIAAELSASLDTDEMLEQALSSLQQAVGANQGAILRISDDSEQLFLQTSSGSLGKVPAGGRPTNYTMDESLAGWVIRNRQAVLIEDLSTDNRWIPFEDEESTERSAIVVPLLTRDDAIGSLVLISHATGAFTEDHLELVSAASLHFATAIQNAELYTLIREQADRLGLSVRGQQVEASKSRAILNSIADGVVVTDSDHRIVLFNPASERIFGLSQEEVIHQSVFFIIGVYGAAGERWARTMRSWGEGELPIESWVDRTEKIELEDGRVVRIAPAPVVLGNEFLGTVSIFRDITRDVEVDRLKSEFVATVSHELRTPMTSIKGFVDLMLMGASGALNEQQRRFLQIVKSNTERLEILVKDLLDISRIESGKATLVIEALSVYPLLREAENFVHHLSLETGKEMQVLIDATDELPRILGDSERIRQIITNIVENSFHYTPAGGIIKIQASQVEEFIEIEIADNGIGIPLADQERIFDRFYRGEQALTMGVPGTGLGLSIVLHLVNQHKGRIWVSSEGIPGKGTTFTIALPAVIDELELAGEV